MQGLQDDDRRSGVRYKKPDCYLYSVFLDHVAMTLLSTRENEKNEKMEVNPKPCSYRK